MTVYIVLFNKRLHMTYKTFLTLSMPNNLAPANLYNA